MTVLVLLLFHKRKLIYDTTFYHRDSTPSYLYKHSRKVPFIAPITISAVEYWTTDLNLSNIGDFCCRSTRSSLSSIISLDYFLPASKGSATALEIFRDKNSFETMIINSIGGARKGFPNIWKIFRTNVSPWWQEELWRIIQKSYRQYIDNNKWEHWSPNNHTKPLKLYVYISIAFLENTVTSLLLQLSVPNNICPIFTFSVILKIMLTVCLRVVGTVRGSGISGNKSLK